MKPKRTNEAYLRGWYLVQTKGNYRLARDLAREHVRSKEPQ